MNNAELFRVDRLLINSMNFYYKNYDLDKNQDKSYQTIKETKTAPKDEQTQNKPPQK